MMDGKVPTPDGFICETCGRASFDIRLAPMCMACRAERREPVAPREERSAYQVPPRKRNSLWMLLGMSWDALWRR
jgi:hypothetical protein